MAGWCEGSKNEWDEHRFVLEAANAELILRSRQCASKASAPASGPSPDVRGL